VPGQDPGSSGGQLPVPGIVEVGDGDGDDVETMAELVDRGVAQLVVSDTLPPDGVDVLPPGTGTTADSLAERAVARLIARLRG